MPSGAGPEVGRVTSGSPAASEIALVTVAGLQWSAGLPGILLSASVNFTPGTGQTLTTLRIRQGSGTGGTLVGISHPITTVAAQQLDIAFEDMDTSSFATSAQANGAYTLTIQTNAAGPGTVNQAVLEVETTAPIQ